MQSQYKYFSRDLRIVILHCSARHRWIGTTDEIRRHTDKRNEQGNDAEFDHSRERQLETFDKKRSNQTTNTAGRNHDKPCVERKKGRKKEEVTFTKFDNSFEFKFEIPK